MCCGRTSDGLNVCFDARYDDLEEMIREGKGWKELVFTSASGIWLEREVYEYVHPDGTVTTWKEGHSAHPEAWDRMIKERDDLDSGACAEMWSREGDGVWRKFKRGYVPKGKDEDGGRVR